VAKQNARIKMMHPLRYAISNFAMKFSDMFPIDRLRIGSVALWYIATDGSVINDTSLAEIHLALFDGEFIMRHRLGKMIAEADIKKEKRRV
jgi:hypothetical protein